MLCCVTFESILAFVDKCHSRYLPCSSDGLEYALAVAEDLVDFFEVKTVSLWEEEIHGYTTASVLPFNCKTRSHSNSHGKMRKKFVHAKTRKYRHPMVEKAIGVISATMKL